MKKLSWILVFLLLPAVFGYNIDIIETSPSPIVAGGYADITFRVVLAAGTEPRSNVQISLRETDYVRPVAGENLTLGQFEEGTQVTRTIRAFFSSDIAQGTIPISFSIIDDSTRLNIQKDVFVLGSENEPEFYVGSIESIPSELLPDTTNNKIIMSLQNLGEKEAELITVELAETDVLKESGTYSMRDSLSSLDGGEEKDIEFNFDIESQSAVSIETTLSIRYRTKDDISGSYETSTAEIPIIIRTARAPDFEIEEIESSPLKSGTKENLLLIKLKNEGPVEGESVRLRIYPDPEIPFDFTSTSYYISSIVYPGEIVAVPIELDIKDDALIRTYPINAEVESMVGSSRYIETIRIPVEVVGHAADTNVVLRSVFIVIAFAVTILLGVGVYRARQKKK
jgi:hypothetical protein